MTILQHTLAGFSASAAVDLSSKDIQERLSRSAISAFFKIGDVWELRDESARQRCHEKNHPRPDERGQPSPNLQSDSGIAKQ